MERTHTLVFRQRQDTNRERKSNREFSWEDEGASSRITELRTAGSYTHTGECWGLAGICPMFLPGTAFARFGWIYSDCNVPYFLIIKSISYCCTGFPILGFSRGFHTQNNCHYCAVMLWVISQFYIPLHTVKDIHVWLLVEIFESTVSPSLNLQKIVL